MAALILQIAILALFLGGALMVLASKRAALLDARISMAIGHKLFSKRMRRQWGSQEEFKKFLTSKKILSVYKIAGSIAILVAIGLAIFLVTNS